MSTKPYRTSRLAQFVTRRVLELKPRKTQAQIAAEAGFPNPNMISMIKGGASKLALDRVPSLAVALECDPARMVLLWAEKQNLISKAPHVERPGKPAPKDAWLTREEVRALIDAAQAPHLKLAIRLMIATGARNEAALQLTWDRVDLERETISLRDPLDTTHRKGRATVPINASLKAALVEAKSAALTPYVIEWAGHPIKSIKKGIKAAARAIGRPDTSPHMLRHSVAVWLAEDGHSMDEIAQFLGHKNSRITASVYARFSPTHLRKLADSLDV